MDEIKFLRGLQASYDALQNKSSLTFYYCTDTDNLYVGEELLSNNDELDAAIQRIAANEIDIETLSGIMTILTSNAGTEGSVAYSIEELRADILDDVSVDYDTLSKIEGQIESLADVARSGSAADVAVSNAGVTANTVQAAIKELHDGITELTTDSVVTLEEASTATASMFKTYNFYQGDTSTVAAKSAAFIGKIDIPKDFLVKSGKIVTVTNNRDSDNESTSGLTNGTYLKLVLNSTDGLENASKIYISVTSLIDVYSGAANASEVQIAVDNYVISATVVDVDASKVTYIAGSSRESVKAALQRLDGDDTVSGSVSKKIKDAIDALVDDSDISQSKVWSSAKVQGLIAEEYDAVNGAYEWGDYCIYENKLFRCTYPTGGLFKAANWTEVDIADGLIGGIIRRGSGAFSYTTGGVSGKEATASAYYSQAIGEKAVASGVNSYSSGNTTKATGDYSRALGMNSEALNDFAYAYGHTTKASGVFSHAEGSGAKAQNDYSYAYGYGTTASGTFSHAEGNQTTAQGDFSRAEGLNTTASGAFSYADGQNTTANHAYQHVFGMYNVADTNASNSTERGNYIEIVGNGTANNARSNARTLDWDGNEVLAGKLTVGSGPSNNMDVATKQYVDNTVDSVSSDITDIIADQYSATLPYSVGDYCIRDGNLYRCTTAIETPEAWNSSHWAMVTLASGVTTVFNLLSDKQDKLLWDATPTKNSTKSVSSGGIYTALSYCEHVDVPTELAEGTNLINLGIGEYTSSNSTRAKTMLNCPTQKTFKLTVFNRTSGYKAMKLIDSDGYLYTNAEMSGSWRGWIKCATSGELGEKADLGIIAPQYDSTSTYAVGEHVIYEGELYKCSTAIETAEDWTAAHWTKVLLTDEIESNISNLATLENTLPTESTAQLLLEEEGEQSRYLQYALDTIGERITDIEDTLENDLPQDESLQDIVDELVLSNDFLDLIHSESRDLVEDIDDKADKVSGATSGNFAGLDANGNLTDSGSKAGDFVSDVTINGTSVVSSGVAEIPAARTNTLGLVKVSNDNGVNIAGSNNLYVVRAISEEIKAGNVLYKPITPVNQHESVFYGLTKAAGVDMASSANAVGTYTDEAKAAIKNMLGVSGESQTITVSGTTPTITAQPNTRYICGEVLSLDFTPCATGICNVTFTSGSTVTVLSLPNTVKMPEWFEVETNTTYEISIMDGVYGAVMSWAV